LAVDPLLPPLESMHEVWACGVTYLRSREAREIESEIKDVYEKVYTAERPEIFFKSIGWRVAGHNMPIRIRRDSRWNVPEPELTLVINSYREIVGFCCGNDVSSRDIEGQNPLYLPQAKTYNGSCAIGPGIEILDVANMTELIIRVEIIRSEEIVFQGDTKASRMKRSFEELVAYLTRELDFPNGVFLMTGTGVVPADDFSLQRTRRFAVHSVLTLMLCNWALWTTASTQITRLSVHSPHFFIVMVILGQKVRPQLSQVS
jgi:2-dehydro-3-deoxy-D-arabinonate dehydratase